MRFRKSEFGSMERELRSTRPEPSDELVRTIARRVRPRQAFHLAPRVVLAGALTVAMLAAVASVGGTTAAVRPAVSLGDLVKQIVTPAGNNNANGISASLSSQQSSATNQYKFIICHHPPGNPSNAQTLEVGSQAAVDAHLNNHPGDTVGPCAGDAPRR